MFFLSCTATNLEVWAVAVPGQREKSLVLQLVANEQDNWAILTIKSSVRLNWGLFRHSISYMVSLWRRNTTDTSTQHRITNVCCETEENITGSVNSLWVSETFQRCLSSAVTKNWPPLKFTGKNELTNFLLKKLEFIWPIRLLFQFCFFLGLL